MMHHISYLNIRRIFTFIYLFILIFSSCNYIYIKADNLEKELVIEGERIVEVGSNVTFKVTSERRPVSNVSVKLGNNTKLTNRNGEVFLILNEPGAYNITACKTGYVNTTISITTLYPKINNFLKIRGFQQEFLPQGYNPDDYLEMQKLAGANYIELKAHFLVDENFTIKPTINQNTTVDWSSFLNNLAEIISRAHKHGLKVYLEPFLKYHSRVNLEPPFLMSGVPEKHKQQFLRDMANISISLAKFSQEHNIELFAPVCELHHWVGWEDSSKWHQFILSDIKNVYDGELIVTYINVLEIMLR